MADRLDAFRIVIGDLKEAGSYQLQGVCPFWGDCGDKSPGHFYINSGEGEPDKKGLWKCHLCGRNGNSISFVKQLADAHPNVLEEHPGLADLVKTTRVKCVDGTEARQFMKAMEWSWRNWWPRGMQTILAGDPGEGKTVTLIYLIGVCAGVWPWPDGRENKQHSPVLFLETEGRQPLVLEKMVQWGVPLDFILFPGEAGKTTFRLDQSGAVDLIAEMAQYYGTDHIMIDSLRGTHRGDENSSQMAGFLQDFANMLRDTNRSGLITHHLRKRSQFESREPTLERLRGSSVIAASAVVAWGIYQPLKNSGRCRVSVMKSNVGLPPPALGLRITDQALERIDAPKKVERAPSKLEETKDFLREELASGPVQASKIERAAKKKGISPRSLRRASQSLRIVKMRTEPGNVHSKFQWSLPEEVDEC